MTQPKKPARKKPMPKPIQEHPWDRIPNNGERHGESPKAFHAFTVYRDMGAVRSLAKTVHELGKPAGYKSLLEKWSRDWKWVDRVAAFDQYMDKLAQEEVKAAREEMIRRQIEQAVSRQNFGVSIRGVAAGTINEMVKLQKEGKALKLSPHELAKILEAAIKLEESGEKLERLCRGEPTETSQLSGALQLTGKDGGPLQLAHMSDEEVKRLAREILTNGKQ